MTTHAGRHDGDAQANRGAAPAETPPTPPTVATETAKQPVTVENDDDGPHPPDALATARKLLDDKSTTRR